MQSETQFVLLNISLGGFVVQRVLEVIDPIIIITVRKVEAWEWFKKWKVTEEELKAPVEALAGLGIGTLAAMCFKIGLADTTHTFLNNPFFIGFMISGGSEGVNILTKFFDYLKEGRKLAAGMAPQREGG